MKRRKGYSYLRYSSPRQTLGDSERRQVEATARYAAQLDVDLDETMIDRGTSAYHAIHKKKGHWGTFVDRVDRGEIARDSILFVEALDRMSREKPRIALNGFLDLVNAGIEIITTMDGQHFTAESMDANDGQIHMSLGIMRGAHTESANKARRVKEAWTVRRDKVTGKCPAWLKPKTDKSGYEPIPSAQVILDRIFQECRDGNGLERIALHLNKDGVSNFTGSATGWAFPYIRKIITGRAVRGELAVGEVRDQKRVTTGKILKPYPEMVSESVWQSANDALVSRHNGGGQHTHRMVNLLTGLTTCGTCGRSMRLRSGSTNNYLQCSDSRRGLCINRKLFNYDRLESLILKTFGTTVYQIDDQTEAQSAMSNQIALAQHEADELAVAYKEANRIARKNPGKLADESLAEAEAEHAAKLRQVEELEKAYRRIASEPRTEQVERVRLMIASMNELNGEDREALRAKLNADFKRLFDRVIFKPDGSVMLRFGTASITEPRLITICEPPQDTEYLTTVDQVLAALKAGHAVGMCEP